MKVIVQGLKGYGINYGVCYPLDNYIEINCTLDNLGKTIYKLLNTPQWEELILKVIY